MSDAQGDLGAAAAPAPTPPNRGGRVREFVSNRPAKQRIGVLAGVVILATAPFGGLRSASETEVQPLVLGQRLDLGAFYVSVDKVSQVPDLAPAVSPEPGNRILAIKVTVTNHSKRAELASQVALAFSGTGTGAVPWPDDDEPALDIYDVNDASSVRPGEYVNPGSTYEWVLALQQRPDVDLDDLALSVYAYHFREVDPQTLDPNIWVVDAEPLVEGHVPVAVVD